MKSLATERRANALRRRSAVAAPSEPEPESLTAALADVVTARVLQQLEPELARLRLAVADVALKFTYRGAHRQ